MADYNWDMKSEVGGYLGEQNRPVPTDNAHHDERGLKEGTNDQRTEETFQGVPEPLTDSGDTDSSVRGRKSGHGASVEGTRAHDRPSIVQSQFGLAGTTGSNRTEGSDRHLGETDTSSKSAIDPRASASDQTTAPGGDGWRPEDLTHTQGSKKHELMNKIKEKLPGYHSSPAGETTDPKGATRKGMMEKIKEKLPGQHGNDAGMSMHSDLPA